MTLCAFDLHTKDYFLNNYGLFSSVFQIDNTEYFRSVLKTFLMQLWDHNCSFFLPYSYHYYVANLFNCIRTLFILLFQTLSIFSGTPHNKKNIHKSIDLCYSISQECYGAIKHEEFLLDKEITCIELFLGYVSGYTYLLL